MIVTPNPPGPVVPTYSAYCVAPLPASHVNVTPALGKVEPGAGFVTTALLWFAAVYV